MPQITVNSTKGGYHVNYDKMPDECPHCHNGIEPKILPAFCDTDGGLLFISYYCPRHECNGYFVGLYDEPQGNTYHFSRTLLGTIKTKYFSDVIKNISKDFIRIYSQAEIAEQNSLNEICGVGYRKALEFLIKDYLISLDNGLKEKVENALLGKCINEHIKDERIKNVAKRASWLGNDETHYVRKWENKTINDLKTLIDLTVHWIETEDLTNKMIAAMPE